MARQDTTDFLTAFAVGTVLGIGATLLLRPEPRTARERLLRNASPARRRIRKSVRRARAAVRDAADGAGVITGDAVDAGRELLSEFRDEVRRILDEAREELKNTGEDGARAARRKIRRARRRLESQE
jgi:gas vesicle protein